MARWEVYRDDVPNTFDVVPYPYQSLQQEIDYPARIAVAANGGWTTTATQARPNIRHSVSWQFGGGANRILIDTLSSSTKPCVVPLQPICTNVLILNSMVLEVVGDSWLTRAPDYDWLCLASSNTLVYKMVLLRSDTTVTLATALSSTERDALTADRGAVKVYPCVLAMRQGNTTHTLKRLGSLDGASMTIAYGSPTMRYNYATLPDLTKTLNEAPGRSINVGNTRVILNDEVGETIDAPTLVRRKLQSVTVASSIIVPDHEVLLRRLNYVYTTSAASPLHPLATASGDEQLMAVITKASISYSNMIAAVSLSGAVFNPNDEITSP